MDSIISIDLGTYNSAAACVLPNGEVTLLKPYYGETVQGMVFPSFLKFYANGELEKYGEPAKEFLPITPDLVVWGIKRLLGKTYDNAKEEIQRFRYPIEKANDGSIIIPFGNRRYTISELTRLFLEKIRADCEEDFNPIKSNVTKAIITHPAYFDTKQIEALREASEGAGFEEVELVTEPEAAAVAYKDILDFSSEKWVMVIDWGAGTLDIVIVGFSLDDRGIPKIRSKFPAYGDSRFGGIDMDDAFCERVKETYGLKDVDSKTDANLRTKIEMAKIALSAEPWTVRPFLYNGKNINLNFVRDEETLKDFGSTDKTWIILKETLQDILGKFKSHLRFSMEKEGISAEDIDQLILVGGPMYMPCVRERIKEVFKENDMVKKQLDIIEKKGFPVSPLESVVRGAIIRSQGEEEVITGAPILPYTYGFLLEGMLVKSTVASEGIPVPDKLTLPSDEDKKERTLSSFKDPGETLSVSLYKKARTVDGDMHYNVGDYEFLPVAVEDKSSAFIPALEIDKDLVVTLKMTDEITKRTLELRFAKEDGKLISQPPILEEDIEKRKKILVEVLTEEMIEEGIEPEEARRRAKKKAEEMEHDEIQKKIRSRGKEIRADRVAQYKEKANRVIEFIDAEQRSGKKFSPEIVSRHAKLKENVKNIPENRALLSNETILLQEIVSGYGELSNLLKEVYSEEQI